MSDPVTNDDLRSHRSRFDAGGRGGAIGSSGESARRVGLAAALLLAATVATRDAGACAPAPPPGVTVAIAEESALIVWDETTKTEHFVRRASFTSQAKDFGFLVPTPTQPELAEASDLAFSALEREIQPPIERVPRYTIEPTAIILAFFMLGARSAAIEEATSTAPVRVLDEKRVGNYDATVLEADDAGALAEWLRVRGYENRPALAEWLAPYVAKKWKLTAFKIAADAPTTPAVALPGRSVATKAVRMSFKTERPFFPYREPKDQRETLPPTHSTKRSLRVFFLGPKKVTASIGDGAVTFPGKIAWAGTTDPARLPLPVSVPHDTWLTAFEDDAAPRPGVDELWFDPARDTSPVKPPPVRIPVTTKIPIPLDLLAVLGVATFFVVRRLRRRSATPVQP